LGNGEVVDEKYQLEHLLGEGGFATVCLAGILKKNDGKDKIDWVKIYAHREQKLGKTTDGIPESRDQYLENVELRISELRRAIQSQEQTLEQTVQKLGGEGNSHLIEAARRKVRERGILAKVVSFVKDNPGIYPASGKCALKFLKPNKQSPEITERFLAESRNLMGISHENVIPVYDYGRANINGHDTLYYVMEALEGKIDAKVITERFPLRQKLEIIKRAAQGLYAIHNHRLIHRDIKPDNILVTLGYITQDGKVIPLVGKNLEGFFKRDNRGINNLFRKGELGISGGVVIRDVKVTDTGIAKDLMSSYTLTQSQDVIGTPAYASPEQAESSKNVDLRTDIYSLGATLYDFIVGIAPYEDTANSALDIVYKLRRLKDYAEKNKSKRVYKIRERLPPDIILPTEISNQNIPANVLDVIERMMDPLSDLRYNSMEGVVNDMDALIEGRLTSIEEEEQRIEQKRFARIKNKEEEQRRSKKKSYIIGGIGAAAALLLTIGGYFSLRSNPEPVRNLPEPPVVEYRAPEPVVEERLVMSEPDPVVKELVVPHILKPLPEPVVVEAPAPEPLRVEEPQPEPVVEPELEEVVKAATNIYEGAILHMTFDKDTIIKQGDITIVKDLSGNGNDGIVNGAKLVGDENDKVSRFDGEDDYIKLENLKQFQYTKGITISAWINPDVRNREYMDVDGCAIQAIVSHGYITFPHNRQLTLQINPKGVYQFGYWNGRENFVRHPMSEEDVHKWIHLVGTYNDKIYHLYRNGENIAKSYGPTVESFSANWFIGNSSPSEKYGGRPFDGRIDEVIIFNRTLSKKEIQSLYKRGLDFLGEKSLNDNDEIEIF
jgi:serine/threonine protein kinase